MFDGERKSSEVPLEKPSPYSAIHGRVGMRSDVALRGGGDQARTNQPHGCGRAREQRRGQAGDVVSVMNPQPAARIATAGQQRRHSRRISVERRRVAEALDGPRIQIPDGLRDAVRVCVDQDRGARSGFVFFRCEASEVQLSDRVSRDAIEEGAMVVAADRHEFCDKAVGYDRFDS